MPLESRNAALGTTFSWVAFLALVVAGPIGCNKAPATSTPQQAKTESAPAEDFNTRLDKVIEFSRGERHPDVSVNAAWQIVHGLLSYGRDMNVVVDGKITPALEYLFKDRPLSGWKLMKADHGVSTTVDPGSKTGQGHPDQWLGYLAQCGIPKDESLVVAGQTCTLNDLIGQAQWECQEGRESAFTLMAFGVYLPLDAKWKARDGSDWSTERLLAIETRPGMDDEKWLGIVRQEACGGTHPMFAVASTLKQYRDSGGELTGVWKTADERVRLCIQKAREFQQPDGSLSTEFFLRSGTASDLTDKLHATGHTFEFLALALPDDQLQAPWVTQAAEYLVDLLERTESIDLECGALYHATHGLILYRDRLKSLTPEKPKATDAQAAR